jgi:hypothetical protein
MFIANSNTNEVGVALHAFNFSGTSLEPWMRHAFVHRRVNVNADANSNIKLL